MATGSAGPAGDATRHAYTIPHELRYATAEDISGLNPHLSQQLVVFYMASMTMAWLTKTGPGNAIVPELATVVPTQSNGGVSADGKTITYHLRQNVKWSDGAPFTADDVVFSTNAVLNPKNNEVSRNGWDLIEKIDEPDKYTVVYHMKKPLAGFETQFFSSAGANPCILPKHLLGNLPDINHAPYNALPVGIGPFKYVTWKRSDYVEMAANPLYFRGLPKLQKIIFKIIPDRNTVLTQLQAHEIDLWSPVAPHYVPQLRQMAGVTVSVQPSYFFGHIDFNNQHPAVRELAVRQALRYAVDRKTLLDKLDNGLGTVQDDVVSPANPYFDASVPTTPFDLAKARAILDAAGWKPGPDGIRAKNGVRLALDFATSSGTPDVDSALALIQSWWKQIGVAMTIKHYPAPLLFAPYADGGIVYTGKFDAVTFNWGGDPIGDLHNLYECSQIPPNGQNDVRYCNPALDNVMERFLVTLDGTKRRPLAYEEQRTIARDVPTIVLSIPDDIYAYNSDLHGFHPNQLGAFDQMMDVDI